MTDPSRAIPSTGQEDAAPSKKGSSGRLFLFLPFICLIVLAAAWSGYWFIGARATQTAIEGWLAREASQGRNWTCQDKSVGGFPFRFELRCAGTALETHAPNVTIAAAGGPFRAVALAYQPNNIIAELDGPFMVVPKDGSNPFEITWKRLATSATINGGRLERGSLSMEGPSVRAVGATGAPDLSSDLVELHIRPSPGRAADGAYDIAATLNKTRVPAIDGLIRNNEPGDISLEATVTQAAGAGMRGRDQELERWRQAGGRVSVTAFKATKGTASVEAKADLGLDDEHRPAGQIDATVAGLDQVVGAFAGPLGGLFNIRTKPGAAPKGIPLTLTARNGRLMLGPLRIGNLQPVY